MKLLAKLFVVLLLIGGTYLATTEQRATANEGCTGNTCEQAKCARRNCRANCPANDFECYNRCDEAFIATPGVDYECWNNRDRQISEGPQNP